MTRDKDTFSEELACLRDEMIMDKVREAIAENPGNVREALEEIGFTWFDDDCPSEEDEEKAARPTQEILI